MGLALETLGVDLINVLGTRGSRCKPTALRYNFQTADWGIVARGFGQFGGDGSPAKSDSFTASGVEFSQLRFLLGRGGRVDAHVERDAELRRQFAVMFSGILAVRAIISAASKSMIGPSLSVVHTVPSRRRSSLRRSLPRRNSRSHRPDPAQTT